MRFLPRLARAALLSLLPLPTLAGGLACPPGWAADATACDPTDCVAPMGGGLIRVDRYASVPGTDLAMAFDSLEKAVGADGTPLHRIIGETAVEQAGLTGLRRDYAGSTRGQDLRIAMILLRDAGEDILLRAIWAADQDALMSLMIAPTLDSWDPTNED